MGRPTTVRFERLAIIAVCGYMVFTLVTLFARIGPILYPGSEVLAEFRPLTRVLVAIYSLSSVLVNLAIGIWLFRHSRRTSRPAWTWFFFAFFGGLAAAILYLLLPIYDRFVEEGGAEKDTEQDTGEESPTRGESTPHRNYNP